MEHVPRRYDLLSPVEAAKALNVHLTYLYKLLKQGKIPQSYRDEFGRWQIPPEAIERRQIHIARYGNSTYHLKSLNIILKLWSEASAEIKNAVQVNAPLLYAALEDCEAKR